MKRSIFTLLSFLSCLIFFISYLHMPFPYFSSYLSYLHVLSTIPVLISYLLSCTWLVYKPNRYPETNQVCTLRNTAVLSTGSFLRLRSSLRLGLSWVGTLPEPSSCVVLTALGSIFSSWLVSLLISETGYPTSQSASDLHRSQGPSFIDSGDHYLFHQ